MTGQDITRAYIFLLAENDFAGRVRRPFRTALYTGRRPAGPGSAPVSPVGPAGC
jgi:hypothetical protein